MQRKLSLELDTLSVESFETAAGEADEARGTVRGRLAGCTCWASCDCPTRFYRCADYVITEYSCDYTFNDSCGYEETSPDVCLIIDP